MAVRRASQTRGRHALRSRALADELVAAARLRPNELALDLGAGDGVLTAALSRVSARVEAVELDPEAVRRLRERFAANAGVRVVEADATRLRLPSEPFAVVANLPFAFGTAILRRLLEPTASLTRAIVIVEWGLAAKRTAVWPSTLLGTLWATWHDLTLLRRLPPCVFAPPPSVDGAVLSIVRRREPLVDPRQAHAYERFLHRAYDIGSVRDVLSRTQLRRLAHELGFDPRARARDLDATQWARIFGASSAHPIRVPARHAPL